MPRYYLYEANGQVAGPFDAGHIQARLQRGEVDLNTQVCPEGSQDWISIAQAPDISGGMASPSSPAKAPPSVFPANPQPPKALQLPALGYAGPIAITVCLCLIGGIFSIVYTSKANVAAAKGDQVMYDMYKGRRQGWITASIIIGAIAIVLNIMSIAAEMN
ncbi:MAG: GYF domain-containing protein [Phycisphaerales bacterium]|nr:GYF domain-containing protein [Phycisphaerales bacterium]